MAAAKGKGSSLDEVQVQTLDGDVVSLKDWAGVAGDEEWESDGTENIRPSFPVIKIVQGTSTMDGAGDKAGQFWHSDTEEFEEALDVTALLMRDTRAMFEEDADKPVCVSVDGKAPLPNQPLWAKESVTVQANGERATLDVPAPQTSCAECPFSAWGEDGSPPPCKASLAVMVHRGDGTLAQLRVSGKSLRPWRSFVAKKCKPSRIPLYGYALRLTTVRKVEERPTRIWNELVIAGALQKPALAREYSNMIAEQRRAFEEAVARDAEPDEEEATAPAGSEWLDAAEFEEEQGRPPVQEEPVLAGQSSFDPTDPENLPFE